MPFHSCQESSASHTCPALHITLPPPFAQLGYLPPTSLTGRVEAKAASNVQIFNAAANASAQAVAAAINAVRDGSSRCNTARCCMRAAMEGLLFGTAVGGLRRSCSDGGVAWGGCICKAGVCPVAFCVYQPSACLRHLLPSPCLPPRFTLSPPRCAAGGT